MYKMAEILDYMAMKKEASVLATLATGAALGLGAKAVSDGLKKDDANKTVAPESKKKLGGAQPKLASEEDGESDVEKNAGIRGSLKEGAAKATKLKNTVGKSLRQDVIPTAKAFAKQYPLTAAGVALGGLNGAIRGARQGVNSVEDEDVYDSAGYFKGKKRHIPQKALAGTLSGAAGALRDSLYYGGTGLVGDTIIHNVKSASEILDELIEKEASLKSKSIEALIGAGAGAALGGGIGALKKTDENESKAKNALIGSLIGAAAGGVTAPTINEILLRLSASPAVGIRSDLSALDHNHSKARADVLKELVGLQGDAKNNIVKAEEILKFPHFYPQDRLSDAASAKLKSQQILKNLAEKIEEESSAKTKYSDMIASMRGNLETDGDVFKGVRQTVKNQVGKSAVKKLSKEASINLGQLRNKLRQMSYDAPVVANNIKWFAKDNKHILVPAGIGAAIGAALPYKTDMQELGRSVTIGPRGISTNIKVGQNPEKAKPKDRAINALLGGASGAVFGFTSGKK